MNSVLDNRDVTGAEEKCSARPNQEARRVSTGASAELGAQGGGAAPVTVGSPHAVAAVRCCWAGGDDGGKVCVDGKLGTLYAMCESLHVILFAFAHS